MPWLFAAVILIALLVYGYWPRPVLVDLAAVKRGSIAMTVDDDGETRIRERYRIAAPVTGKLLRLELHAGDRVERGTTELMQILPMDPALLDARTVAESQARLAAADAAIEESQSLLASAESAAQLAEDAYQRANALHKTKSIATSEWEEAEHDHRAAQANLRSAKFRSLVRNYERDIAKAALLKVSNFSETPTDLPFKIISPIDGAVLRVLQEDSSVVAAGTPILEIGDPRDLELQIDVLSNYAVAIEPGATVTIEHWGGPKPLHAKVRVVEPSAFLKVSALGVEEKRVRVIADFLEPWEERQTLGDGYRIEARITLRESDPQSLHVPAGAVFELAGKRYVFRSRANRVERVEVSIGDSNGRQTEIRSGLKEGDRIILHPPDTLREGDIIEAAPSSSQIDALN
ncbi:putative efflux pump membrane fusion protein [Pirellula sp. SH-Sr6A]|nr:putative efflux pump membrane fusion protein [Pirellula sp. SH-Sr6A]